MGPWPLARRMAWNLKSLGVSLAWKSCRMHPGGHLKYIRSQHPPSLSKGARMLMPKGTQWIEEWLNLVIHNSVFRKLDYMRPKSLT